MGRPTTPAAPLSPASRALMERSERAFDDYRRVVADLREVADYAVCLRAWQSVRRAGVRGAPDRNRPQPPPGVAGGRDELG